MPAQQQVCVRCFVHEREPFGFERGFQRGIDTVALKVGQLCGVITRHFAAEGIKANGLGLGKVIIRCEVDDRLWGFRGACCQSEQHEQGGGMAGEFHSILHRSTSDTSNVAGLSGRASAERDRFVGPIASRTRGLEHVERGAA